MSGAAVSAQSDFARREKVAERKALGAKLQWRWTTLGEVVESMKNGIYKARTAYCDDGVPCLRMYNIERGQIVWKDVKRMRLSENEVREYGLQPGDLLVNRVNSRELVGKTAVIRPGLETCVFESKNIRVRLKTDVANPRFVSFALLANGQAHFTRNAQQVVGMASISQPQVAAFPLPLPPLDEQQRIVAEIEKQFTRLDAGVASLKRIQVALKRCRASVLKAACEGRLVPTDKKRWRNVTFGELCHVQGGYAFKSSDYQSEGIALIRISNLVNSEVTIDLKTPRLPPTYVTDYSEFLLRTGDVLIAMSGATTGKMATFMLNEPALLNQRVGRFIVKADADATREYLALVVEQIARQVLRDAYGAAQPNISPKKIEAMNLAIPPMAEQIKIVADVERRVSVVEELYQAIAFSLRRADALRRSILQQAFTARSEASALTVA